MTRRKEAQTGHAPGVASAPARPGAPPKEPDPAQERELQVANEALNELTARYRALFDTNPQPILVWDLETLRILDANDAAIRRYGWTLEEFRKITLKDVRPPETVPRLIKWLAQNHEGITRSGIFRHHTKSGEEFDAEVISHPLTFSGRMARLSVVSDVTERVHSEAVLRASEAHLRSILDSALDAVVGMDESGLITFWSPSAERMFGWPRDEALGKVLADLIVPERYRKAHVKGIRRFLETGDGPVLGRRIEMAGLNSRGEEFPIELMITALRTDGSWSFTAFCTDLSERRRTEVEIRRYADIVRNIPIGLTVLCLEDRNDANSFRMLARNPAGSRLAPGRDEEVLNRRVVDLPPEIVNTDVLEQYRDVVLTGIGRDLGDFQFNAREGGKRLFALRAFPLPNDCVGVAYEDVTERRQAEESRSRLAAIVESSDDAIVSTDLENVIQTWNPGAEHIFGYSAEEMIGRNSAFLIPDDRIAELEGAIERLMGGEGFEVLETERLRRDGTPVVVSLILSPIRDAFGRLIGTSAFMRDLTVGKRSEKELRESEARYRQLFETAPVGIFQSARDGTLMTANEELARLLGYDSVVELMGRNLTEIYYDPEQREAAIRAYPPFGQVAELELTWKRRDGTPVQVQLNVRAVKDELGETRYFEGFVRDVTQRVRLEEQLRQSQKMEAIGRLAGGIAHDFNNLLTAILGYSDLALAEVNESASLQFMLSEIRNAGERAAALTRQLLAFSRRQVLQPQILDLNAVVQDILQMLHRLIGEDVRLVTRLDPALEPVQADPGQLQQVLLNLAVNARDAMPEGGDLTLETGNLVLDEVDARAYPGAAPGAYVRLSVTDTGIGMDSATLARVFEPFFTTKEPGKGTGLGLSTVYGIVQQTGGQIGVRSAPGEGATFDILLPRADATPIEASSAREGETHVPSGSGTVLLAEDEVAVRGLICGILESDGYKVIESASASEALAKSRAHEGPIRLFLTDLIMPGASVTEVVAQLRKERPEMKFVYMSGYTELAAGRPRALEAGTTFIQKPFMRAGLLAVVKTTLEKEAS